MNVLQAMEKLNDLKDKCKVLDLAIEKFKQDQKDYKDITSYEIQLLTQISDEYEQRVERLRHQLENTQLTTVRGVDDIYSWSTDIRSDIKYEVK